MGEVVIGERVMEVTDDNSRLAIADALREASRDEEALLLCGAAGVGASGEPCPRLRVRIRDGRVDAWPAPSHTDTVTQDGRPFVVTTTFNDFSPEDWDELDDTQRLEWEAIIADTHAARLEEARAPADIREAVGFFIDDEYEAEDYPDLLRAWLAQARQMVADGWQPGGG